MTFAQSFYNQNSVLRTNVMIVDDDPVFLQIMSRMLEKFEYKDPAIMEITVIAVKDPREALSTLKIQRNNIDIIVTDYYMPDMNGLQLKKQITREFGNLPVIVMSSDTNKEQESLTWGAMCFIPKPIKATDLTKIYQLALTYKRNGKSTLWTEHNHKNTDVTIPQQIQLLPEQENFMTKKKNKFSPRSDSRSVKSSNGSFVSTDGSRKHQKISNGGSGDDVESLSQPSKKRKIMWTDYLHDRFLQAIRHIGLDKAVPKKILEFMNVSYLTRENVASHLQKYRQFLRKVAEKGSFCSSMLLGSGIDSIYPYPQIRESYYNNCTPSWYDTSLNNKSFYSKPGYGQSKLLSNTTEPVCLNQMPYNYTKWSSTYEPHCVGSNLTLSIKNNLNFSSQPAQEEGKRSFLEPIVMANKTSQTSQVLGFGNHGISDINGNSFNSNTLSSYGSLTRNQPEISSYASSTSTQTGMISHGSLALNQPGMSSYISSTSTQPGMVSHGSLTPNKLRMNSYGSLTSTQSEMSSHRSLSANPPGMSNYGILTSNKLGMSSHGSLSPNQPGIRNYGNLTPNQLGLSSHESLTPNHSGLNSFGSVTHSARLNSYERLTPHQPGSSNFSHGLQSFSNNESTANNPQPHANATTQSNLGIPQLENLRFYDELDNTNELLCDISNFQFDHNKEQEKPVSTTQFDLSESFPTEMNQFLSFEEDGDRTFVNINQGHSDEETSNNFAMEMNSQIFNMSHNHDQEQDVPDFLDWSLLNPEDLANDYDFMDSLFTSDDVN